MTDEEIEKIRDQAITCAMREDQLGSLTVVNDRLNDLLYAGEFDSVSKLLDSSTKWDLPLDVLIGILMFVHIEPRIASLQDFYVHVKSKCLDKYPEDPEYTMYVVGRYDPSGEDCE